MDMHGKREVSESADISEPSWGRRPRPIVVIDSTSGTRLVMIRPSISLVSPMRLRPVPAPEPVAETHTSGASQNHEAVHPATRREVNKSTIESLIQQNYAGLRLLLRRRTGDPEVAADLLNEAICITWEKWQESKIERPEEIAGYIFQVELNLLRNRRP